MFKKKIDHTKFIFVVEDPLTVNTDILVNWTTTTLVEGDELFVRIFKEGGSLISREILRFKSAAQTQNVNMSQIVVTGSGILPCKRLLHAVLPNYRNKIEKAAKESHLVTTIDNIFYFIKNNKEDFESARTIAFTTIPTKVYGTLTQTSVSNYIRLIREHAINSKMREVYIICTEENYKIYQKEFNLQTTNRLQRFLQRLGFN